MKRKIITCDICEKDITNEDIRYKFKQRNEFWWSRDDFEFLKWTKLDMCHECHRKFVKFARDEKEITNDN